MVNDDDVQYDGAAVENGEKVELFTMPTQNQAEPIDEWNNTNADFPSTETLHQLFEKEAKRAPDKLAIICQETRLTYKELSERSNQLACHLQTVSNIKPDTLIALFLDKSELMIISILAVWKSGAAHVPIDPSYPDSQIKFILEDTQAMVVITNQHYVDRLKESCLSNDQIRVIEIEAFSAQSIAEIPVSKAKSSDLCYVTYTSGTTGLPKGVMKEHISVVNSIVDLSSRYKICEGHHMIALFSTYVFEPFLRQMLMALLNSQTLVVVRDEVKQDPLKFSEFLKLHEITYLNGTASVLQQYNYSGTNIIKLLFAGEELTKACCNKIRETFKGIVINEYGPTESAFVTAYKEFSPTDQRVDRSIGKPVSNVKCYILNDQLQQVPIGEVGEIFIGGVGVSRGYLNHRDLTASRFLKNPFQTDKEKAKGLNARIYKTGDLARRLPNGELEFLGRSDNQVKINGFRIEPSGVERFLCTYPGVKQCVVIAKESKNSQCFSSDKHLVGYIVADGTSKPLENNIKAFLQTKLPSYMVPIRILQIEKIPVTINGKLDAKALPDIEFFPSDAQKMKPMNSTEFTLCEIWADIFEIPLDQLSIDDNFFQVGGDSIKSIQLIGQIRKSFNLSISITDIFNLKTIENFASHLISLKVDKKDGFINQEDVLVKSSNIQIHEKHSSDSAELIFLANSLQQGFMYHYLKKSTTNDDAYIIQNVYQYHSEIQIDKMRQAWEYAQAKFYSLRLKFIASENEVVQVIDKNKTLDWRFMDISEQTLVEQGKLIKHIQETDRKENYQLEKGNFFCLYLIEQDTAQFTFLFSCHHIILDGWSFPVLFNYVHETYLQLIRGDPVTVDADSSYLEAQTYLQNHRQDHVDYWSHEINRIEERCDLNGLLKQKHKYKVNLSDYDHIQEQQEKTLSISGELYKKLKEICSLNCVTLHSILQFVWHKILRVYGNSNQTVVGTIVSGRNIPVGGIENAVGLFINTLPLIVEHEQLKEMTIVEAIKFVQSKVQEINSRSHVELAQLNRGEMKHQLFDSLFVLENYANSDKTKTQLHNQLLKFESKYTNEKLDYPLAVVAKEIGKSIAFTIMYAGELFEDSIIAQLLDLAKALLEQITRDCNYPVDKLEFLTPTEKLILEKWNETAAEFPSDTLHQIFEVMTEKYQQKIAVIYEDKSLTYEQLNEKSNQVAHCLRSLTDIHPGILIVLFLDKSELMIISILGVWKSGAAYVPIDPSYTDERIQFILKDTQTKVIITNQCHASKLQGKSYTEQLEILEIEALYSQSCTEMEAQNPSPISSSTDLAYVIYTSGTTGNPKGVMVEHTGVVNLQMSLAKIFSLQERNDEVLFSFSNYVFDHFVEQMTDALLNGQTLLVLNDEMRFDKDRLYQYMSKNKVTYLSGTPSVLQMYEYDKFDHCITRIDAVGEDFSEVVFNKMRCSFGGLIINGYGPTEISITSHKRLYPFEERRTNKSIGMQIANTTCYVLNSDLKRVPIGGVGELFIGGAGVALGYLNRLELTADRFLINPFQTEEDKLRNRNGRIYKTGDMVRWLPNGEVEYLGRNDFQVKIRGLRIELGEIESVLSSFPGITQAVVVAKDHLVRDDDKVSTAHNRKYLVGYYVSDQVINEAAIKKFMQKKLPDYMIPNRLVPIDKIQVTISGKLDTKSLPEIEFSKAANDYVAPKNEIQTKLCYIWSDLLGIPIENIGVHDDFFTLGGDSLLVQKLFFKISKTFSIGITVASIFQHRTIESMSNHILNLDDSLSAIQLKSQQDIPVSFAQERLMFIDEYEGGTDAYNICLHLKIPSKIDKRILKQSLQSVIARHEILRTLIVRQQGSGAYLQHIIDREQANSMFVVQEIGISDIDELNQKLSNASKHVFRLDKELPIRVAFYKNNSNNDFYIMSVILHHICFDGWSWKIFQRDLNAFYDDFTNNGSQSLNLPNLDLQYKDFAIWQREAFSEAKLETLSKFWKSKLECFENLQLMPDFSRPAHFDYSGKDVYFELDEETTANLKRLAMELNVSIFSLLVSAHCLVLGNFAKQKDIVIGTPVANRNRPELENAIGFFVNILVLRLEMPPKCSVVDYIQRVSDEVIDAQIHQEMPFEKLVKELKIEKDLSRHPIVQVVFSLNPFESTLKKYSANSNSALEMTNYIPANNDHQIAKYDISTTISEYETSIKGHFNYATKLFHENTVHSMIETYQHILKQFAKLNKNSELKLTNIECLLDTNSTSHFVSSEVACVLSVKTLNQLFEDEVEKSSKKIAIVSGDVTLTYAELNKKSNQLAHYLHSVKSIDPDCLIALLLDKNEHMIISVLGIWKSGAAYVPIDPSYPDDRIQFFLEETKAKIIITNQHYGSRLKGITKNSCAIVEIDNPRIAKSVNIQSITNYRSDSNENNLAYVIYTSGTSGKPKGVLIEHKGVVNLRNDLIVHYFGKNQASDQQQAILFLSNYVFDFSIEQIILSILSSNKLILVPNKLLIDDQLYDYLNINSLSYLSGTPSYVQQIDLTKLKHLQTVTVAGEAFTKKHFEKIRNEFNGTLNNAYGITETTVYNMVYRFEGESGYKNSLGQILSNMKLYVLNENLQQLSKGAIGELYLSGNCVARGYLNRPYLTAERFLRNPFQTEEDKRTGQFSRMYKSGDLVRYRYDGELEYLGRNDFQVKIRGLRIELREIETILASFPGVKQCTVVTKSHHSDVSPDSKFLVAYFVSEGNCKIEEDQIKTFMLRKLPDYMIPVKLIRVNDHLPITINGKLDIKSLPKIEFSADRDTLVAPRNVLENQLCNIWSQILGIENISIDEDFFKIGGDSILSQQLVGRIRHDLKVKISVKDIFVYKTIRHLYEHVLQNSVSDNCPKIDCKVEDGILTGELPLLPIQQWFFSKDLKNRNHWNQTFVIKTPELDMEKLKNAIIKLIEHHDAFRLRFKSRDGIFVQYYDSEDFSFLLHTHDMTKDQNLKQAIAQWQSSLDIENGPIFFVAYMHGYEDGWNRLLFTMHHLIVDTVSWRIICQDLHSRYNGGDLGRKGSSYRQWTQAVQQFSQNSQSEAAVWQKLANKTRAFNANLSRIANNGKSTQTNFMLTNDQTEMLLKKCNKTYGTQINDLLLTALAYALPAVTQNEVNYVTLEGHGREEIDSSLDISRTIGWFTTMYPVELCLGTDLANSIENMKTSLNSIPNKGLGYGSLMGYDEKLPRVSFNYLGQFDSMPKESWNFENLTGEYDLDRSIDSQKADHDLISVTALCSEGQMRFHVSSRLGDSKADQFSSVLKMKLSEIISNSTKIYSDQSRNDFIQEFDPYVEFSGKSGTILFMFPPGEGGAESYMNNLVRKLNFFKLIVFNNYYLHTNKQPTTFEKLAEFYISYIKQIQPQGPYNFVGWSFGGVLGLEISCQMVENGDIVTNLILIDSYFNVQKACEDIQRTDGFILDRINYLYSYSQKLDNFKKLASTAQNIVLFKACQLNDTFKTVDEKMLYEYFMHSQCNNLDTLLGHEFIKVTLMHSETHESWVYNEDQLTSMSDCILALF